MKGNLWEQKSDEGKESLQNEFMIEKIKEVSDKPKKKERPSDVTEVTGVLEVMPDEFGFLRFENFASSNSDIYVSPTQIKRFNLKTGDEIIGDCRITEEEDKSSPLLFVRRINGDPLEVALKRKPFEKRVPVFPEEKIKLEISNNKSFTNNIVELEIDANDSRKNVFLPNGKYFWKI